MKISELTVKNVKGVRSISFSPTDVNRIGGDNGQGKSSLLDAIILTLKQKAMGKFTEKVIRDGEDFATTEILFNDGNKVKSTWYKSGKRELSFSNKSQGNVPSPQKTIDELIGELTFDPLRFHSQSKEEQVNTLLQISGGSMQELNRLKEKRRDEKRELLKLQKVIEQETCEPARRVNLNDLLAKAREKEELLKLQASHNDTIKQLTESIAEFEAIVRFLELATKEREQAGVVERLESDISRIRAENRQKIAGLNLLDGLDVDDETGSLVVNGLPIKQLSSAEQMVLAVKLAMQTNSRCKVLILQNASLLDKKALRQIMDICTDSGWQLFIETVGVGDIIISEGSLLDESSAEQYRKEYLDV